MSSLIPFAPRQLGSETIPTVNARDLHAFLGSKRDFSHWIKDRIQKYGFEEERDFTRSPVLASDNPNPQIDYFVSFNMAKELSMVERTPKGKEARLYFIDCEERANESQLPALHDPVLHAVIQSMVLLDKTRYELAQTTSLVATHETKLNLLLASQERLTIREYVWMNELQPQMPGSLCKAFRKHLNRYCFDNNIPVRTIRTGAQQRQLSNVYPAQAIAATLPGWLIRRNGQLPLSPR